MVLSQPHAVALSRLTCVGNLASYLESEAVWEAVRKLVETIALLIDQSLNSHRSWGMLTMTTTCAQRQFICVARYGPIFNNLGVTLRSCECASPAPFKKCYYQIGVSIPVGNVVVLLGRFFFVGALYHINN
jgi:hypothetical protein